MITAVRHRVVLPSLVAVVPRFPPTRRAPARCVRQPDRERGSSNLILFPFLICCHSPSATRSLTIFIMFSSLSPSSLSYPCTRSLSYIVFVIIIHFFLRSSEPSFFFCFAVVFLSVRVFSPPYTRTTIYNIIHIIRHHDTLYCFLFYFLSYTLHTTHIIYVHMSHIIRCTRTRVLYVCRLAWIFICSVLLDSTFFSDHAISRVPVIVFFQPYVIVRVHRGRTYLYVYIKYIFAYVQCVNVSIVYTSQ